ncbi:MAG: hypothetical protein ACP5XB_28795 [Isosphaeraceae bacterium]
MKIRKRLALSVLLVLSAFVGTRLGRALATQSPPNLTPRPTADRSGGRLGMALDYTNTGGPGTLVVSGALVVNDADSHPNQMAVVVRVTAPDGTVVVNETVGTCNVAKDVQQTEYPVRRVYRLPSGYYHVELMGFDRAFPNRDEFEAIAPNCGHACWLYVN